MAHSYRVHHFHIVWSTKGRIAWIHEELQPRLFGYLCAIAGNLGARVLEINGMADHVHLLLTLANLDHYTKIIRELKASSSQWIHKNIPTAVILLGRKGMGLFR